MSVWDSVVGHAEVAAQLRAASARPVHAYLLVGPPGAGSRAMATAFAASLLCEDGGCGACRSCRLVVGGEHPDVLTYEPEGAFLRVDEAGGIALESRVSPMEGRRRVFVLSEFHRVEKVGPALLKTIEEPPESTVFVVLADHVPPELVTISSRCIRLELPALPVDVVASVLEGEGIEPARAQASAVASLGDLDRARVLVA